MSERGAQRQIDPLSDDGQPRALVYEPLDGMLDRFAAVDEYTALLKALKRTPAPCKNVAGFVADHPDAEQLRPVCAGCPVLAQCEAYAAAAKISTGFWAGVDRGRLVRKESAKVAATVITAHDAA